MVIGSTLPSGLYAFYEEQWGITRGQTTVVFSLYVLGVLLSLIFLGHLADKYGRKRIVLLSLSLAITSSLFFLVALTPWVLYFARLLSGLAVGICMGSFTAALSDLNGNRRGTTISAFVTSAALAMGPLASAVIASQLPFKLRLPFAVHVILLLIVFIPTLWTRETAIPQSLNNYSHSTSRELFRNPSMLMLFLACSSAIAWAYGANGLWQSVVPLALGEIQSSQLRVALLASTMLGTSALAQIVTLSLSPERMTTAGLGVLALGLASSAFAISTLQHWLLWVATIIVGVGQGVSFRGSLAIAAQCANPQRQSIVVSIYYVFGYSLTALAPISTNLSSVPAVTYAMAIAALSSALALGVLRRKGASV